MRKRFYIMFVARDSDGQLLKIPIPIHYLYVFMVGALIGMLTITGMAGSYTRMLTKVAQFNTLRWEKQALETNYRHLEMAAQQKDVQVASLGSLASEVSALYGLRSKPTLASAAEPGLSQAEYHYSVDQFYALRSTAMSGVTAIALGMGARKATLEDWVKLAAQPVFWPVDGLVTSSFGERIDPFNGEGAFHRGIDISTEYGRAIIATADGIVRKAEYMGGYGRAVVVEHGQSISTLYGHMSRMAVTPGQRVRRGDTVGYVGSSGRSSSPHLHYEVRINNTPVNPHKYLKANFRALPIENAALSGM